MKAKLLLAGSLLLTSTALHAVDFTVSVPENAGLIIGTKTAHFVDFAKVEPKSVDTQNGISTYTFDLTASKVYNYRTWMADGLTNAGYFTMNADVSKCPELKFSVNDYMAHAPSDVNHDVASNEGYETGDIFVNVNPRGHLQLSSGQKFDAHAMRTWELTDNAVNNYFIEPDFHYTVLDMKGKPSDSVITVSQNPGSAWAEIEAVGSGAAIVLVTYDGINVNYYSGKDRKDYLGGSWWGAIWPENTAVYVVSVDDANNDIEPNMLINEVYNEDAKKLAGKYVDAEHDVFYYLKGEEGCPYTFTPRNVANVDIAYPTIGKNSVSFEGFTSNGVTANSDGSYTVLLKEGRQIVRLQDASGNAVYQVLTAKTCEREISNASRPGSDLYQPGDKVEIRYKGLRHPANKMAGIYNMSAYITYNGTPNGTSLIQSANQYTFGSSEAAQTLTVTIPEDYDAESNPVFLLSDGVIQVNGFGDPIGNHRSTSKETGRVPNLNAVAHKTYFGFIPELSIDLSPVRNFNIRLIPDVADAQITLLYNGRELQAADNGSYSGSFGDYKVIAQSDGYRCYRSSFTLGEEDEPDQIFNIAMSAATPGMWDGRSLSEVTPDEEGIYHISTGAELAYLAQYLNEHNKAVLKAVLDNDIDLGDFDWTPIANTSKIYFSAQFDGQGHEVSGLFIDDPQLDYAGLFGNVQGLSTSTAVIENLKVSGSVTGKQYVGAVAARVGNYSSLDRCANYADVSGSSYVGGVVGYLQGSTKCALGNCYNVAAISGASSVGGVIGYNNKSAQISNIHNVGVVSGATSNSVGACVGGTTDKSKVVNAYTTQHLELNDNSTLVSTDRMASGEIALLLGDAFTQTIGSDPHPVFNSAPVYLDESDGSYYNKAVSFKINPGVGNDKVEVSDRGILMSRGSDYALGVTAAPLGARLPLISWTSSDSQIVTVDNDGLLKAVANGRAVVKAQFADNADVNDLCDVTVATSTSVGSLFADEADTPVEVFDLSGKVIMKNVSSDQLSNLAPGLYIIRRNGRDLKVLIH